MQYEKINRDGDKIKSTRIRTRGPISSAIRLIFSCLLALIGIVLFVFVFLSMMTDNKHAKFYAATAKITEHYVEDNTDKYKISYEIDGLTYTKDDIWPLDNVEVGSFIPIKYNPEDYNHVIYTFSSGYLFFVVLASALLIFGVMGIIRSVKWYKTFANAIKTGGPLDIGIDMEYVEETVDITPMNKDQLPPEGDSTNIGL